MPTPGLIVNKIQSFAKNPVIATDNINERACGAIQLFLHALSHWDVIWLSNCGNPF